MIVSKEDLLLELFLDGDISEDDYREMLERLKEK